MQSMEGHQTMRSRIPNTPFLPRRDFMDRRLYSKGIKAGLASTNHKVALVGPALIGKTITATQYCFSQSPCSKYAYFNCTDAESLLESFKKFAIFDIFSLFNIRLTISGMPLSEIALKVNQVVEESNFIFVFDNVNNQELIEPLLSKNGKIKYIMTSREAISLSDVVNIEMKLFNESEAEEYIRERFSKNTHMVKIDRFRTEEDREALKKLIVFFNGSPDLLYKATQYLISCSHSLSHFLEHMDDPKYEWNVESKFLWIESLH